MDSYKASKAWHVGHELALEVHAVVKQIPASDEFDLAQGLKRLAMLTPSHIAASIEHVAHHKKMSFYHAARDAVIELQEHLMLALDLRYIDRQLHEKLALKAITVQRLLTSLIQEK